MAELPGSDQVARQVVLVQPLLDDDDLALGLVVETGEKRLFVIVPDALALDRRGGIRRLGQVVDDDEVGAEPVTAPPSKTALRPPFSMVTCWMTEASRVRSMEPDDATASSRPAGCRLWKAGR